MQLRADGSAEAVAAFVEHVAMQDLADDEVAETARVLADSGPSLKLSGAMTGDVASTGGPSSLSTLLGPLYLRSLGFTVPTLAVPGRPAGGIDVLATIPGYETALGASEAEEVLGRGGHAHLMAGDTWAPLDAATFAYRQRVGAQQYPALVIASLLAKKVATGVTHVGLDVRIASHGNFGSTRTEAARNADRFITVARLLGISADCLLTDGSAPYQPYIGRGEALVALHEIMAGEAGKWLGTHDDLCWELASRTAQLAPGRPTDRPTRSDLRAVFESNLVAQGASWAAFESRCEEVLSQPVTILRADVGGFARIDLSAIRDVLVEAQRAASIGRVFSDPCGVKLAVRQGSPVEPGQELLRVRARNDMALTRGQRDKLLQSVVLNDGPPSTAARPKWCASR